MIGLGGGATAGAAAAFPNTHLDVVELSASVVRGARYFDHVNGGVVTSPMVRMRTDDGRNFLSLTSKRYDVVMADVIRPQHAGSAALYSLEYYTLARQALKEDGVMIQWIDQRLPENQYQMLLRTFLRAFPYATAWADGAFFVGSESPYAIDRRLLGERLASRAPGAAARSGVATPEDVLRLFTATDEELRRYAGDGPIVTDDHPYIEFFRSLPADPHAPDPAVFRRDPSPSCGRRESGAPESVAGGPPEKRSPLAPGGAEVRGHDVHPHLPRLEGKGVAVRQAVLRLGPVVLLRPHPLEHLPRVEQAHGVLAPQHGVQHRVPGRVRLHALRGEDLGVLDQDVLHRDLLPVESVHVGRAAHRAAPEAGLRVVSAR